MFILDLKSRVPIYEQLKNKMTELIMAGILEQDSQLPSVRSLAKDLGVNPNTIQKAYNDLEKDGIIYSIAGRGSFVSDIKIVKDTHIQTAFDNIEQACLTLKKCDIPKDNIVSFIEKIFDKEEEK